MKPNVAKGRKQLARLEDIPNIGPAVAADLRQLGITTPADLQGRDPYAMYDDLCRCGQSGKSPNCLDQYRPINFGKMPFFVTIGIVEMFTSDTVTVRDSTAIM